MSVNTVLPPIAAEKYEMYGWMGRKVVEGNVLKIVSLSLAGAVLALGFECGQLAEKVGAQKPLIVRVNDVGRAEAVQFHYQDYKPQDAEIRYFLTQFVSEYYGRNHKTIQRDYANSLYFLDSQLFEDARAENTKTKWFAKFAASSDDDVDVTVKNVAIDPKPSGNGVYRARVDFQKVFTAVGGGETKREQWTANVAFTIDPQLAVKDNRLVPVNPLGFSLVALHADQAF